MLVGAFLSMAAWYYDPQQAVGVVGALRSLQDKPYGALLLGLAAIGLACFGLFELAQAARRRLAGLGRITPSVRARFRDRASGREHLPIRVRWLSHVGNGSREQRPAHTRL